jgi:hypothetical protein
MSAYLESQQAEDASGLVWLAVAAYERVRELDASKGESPFLNNGPSKKALSTISEIVGHVEIFVIESLTEHAGFICANSPPPIPELTMASIRRSVESNWNERRKFAKDWLGADLEVLAWWKRWLGFVESRNAWAHGLGRLTERQRRDKEVLSNLRAAGLEVRLLDVVARPTDVRQCARSAIEVIEWTDQQVNRS